MKGENAPTSAVNRIADEHYLIPRPALVAFSGGRTSGYLLKHIIDAYGGRLPTDVVVAFCNTGKEHPKTLDFVHRCETEWNVRVRWLEFDPAIEDKTREVNYETASQDGRPLRDAISTRPTAHLFNPVSRYCSVTCKARRMQKLMLREGYLHWYAAMGLRADEMTRVEKARARAGRDRQTPIVPLADAGVTKEIVAAWWRGQSFDLQLPNVGGITPMGNCILCPLKARAKLVNALRRMPEEAAWWIQQEDDMTKRIENVPHTAQPTPIWDDDETTIIEWKPPSPDRRNRFHKDGTSYRDLLSRAQFMNAMDEPMDEGYDTGIDCLCTD